MQIFLVGGAVRDIAMGNEPKDFDFVVVGSSPAEMLALGFKQVGADFPVFLHPTEKHEFALARIERKTGTGYNGFSCDWDGVTLEQDLSRRDISLNSMSMEVDSTLCVVPPFAITDPFNGMADIKNKVLRHTSDAFSEDPLRVIRIARFLSRFGKEWTVHPDTIKLCGEMFFRGQLNELTPERVWKEMSRALMEPSPELFFHFFRRFELFPEISDLHGVEQRADHHPEIDTFVHVMMCLEQAVKADLTLEERFAVLMHDVGKRPAMDQFGKLHGHEAMGVPLINAFCDRLKVPNDCRRLALIVAEHHTRCHTCLVFTPKKIMGIFEFCDAFRNEKLFFSFLKCCEADARGRLGLEDREYPQVKFLTECYNAAKLVNAGEIAAGITAKEKESETPRPIGPLINEAVRVARIAMIKEFKND